MHKTKSSTVIRILFNFFTTIMKTIIYLTLISFLIFSCKKKEDKQEVIPVINATISESGAVEGQVDFLINFENAISYSVNFGDGLIESGTAGAQINVSHTYTKNGIYKILISAKSETDNSEETEYSFEVTTLPGVSFDVAYLNYSNYSHKICSSYSTYVSIYSDRVTKGQFGSFVNDEFISIAFPNMANANTSYNATISNPTISSMQLVSKENYNFSVDYLSDWLLGGRSYVTVTEKGVDYFKGTFSGDVYSNSLVNGQHVWVNIKNGKFYIKF